MDENREITRQHYDAHAAGHQHLSTSQVLKERASGPAYDLKKFHNDIKRDLIYRFGYQADALIDYACGRGGDIHKWHAAKIKYIKGLDISGVEIEEARRRFRELQDSKGRAVNIQADFQQIDTLGLQVLEEQRQYDLATCMFALHYFFDKPDSLKTLLQTIAGNLKPGGYFLGCVPDGKRVKGQLRFKGADGQEVVRDLTKEHLILKKTNEGWDSFGSRYIMQIPDTVVGAVEGLTEGSEEFLVFEKILLAEAAKVGLHPVVLYEDPKLDQLFEEKDKDKPMKHFNPQYPKYGDGSLSTASQLYMAFVFQKVDSPAAAKAPPLPPPPQSGRQRPPAAAGEAAAGGSRGAAMGARAGGWGAPGQQQGGGGGNKMDSMTWRLPYAATTLRSEDLPSAYHNMRHNNLQKRAQQQHRWILYQPPLPEYPGPVGYDANTGATIYHFLPDHTPVHEYKDELTYHAWQQQQQQQTAAPAAAQGFFPPPPPEPQQQQQQQQRLPGAPPVNGMHPQQQQQQQVSRAPDPPSLGSAAAAAAGSSGPPEATAGRGRGRGGRGRGRGRASAAAGDEVEGATGRGRGQGRGRAAAGIKRERPADTDADAAAAGAAAAAGGGADAAVELPAAMKRVKVEQPPEAAHEAAAGSAGAGTGAAGAAGTAAGTGPSGTAAAAAAGAGSSGSGRASALLRRIQAADPMGYKEPQQPAPLPPEFLEEMTKLAPPYVEQPDDEPDGS